MTQTRTPFDRVSTMNTAFNNPKGDYENIDLAKLLRQGSNVFDEYLEFLGAFTEDKKLFDLLRDDHKFVVNLLANTLNAEPLDPIAARDALCDIQVFALGAQHFMGVDGNADMNAVVDGVMTRFIKDEADKLATIAKHAANGITDVYFEGEYPTMVMKSASDQPDAPKGKFLKSASFKDTVFPPVVTTFVVTQEHKENIQALKFLASVGDTAVITNSSEGISYTIYPHTPRWTINPHSD